MRVEAETINSMTPEQQSDHRNEPDCDALIARFQNGESGAFDEIVERYHRDIYNLAYHFTHNCDDAYDISQEVFIKVFRSLVNLRDSSAFGAWLRRITVNTCIDHLRQQSPCHVSDDLLYMGDVAACCIELPNRPVEKDELRSVIAKAVSRLPEKQRRVFVLRQYQELSLEEIAGTVGRSLGTVKANLFHATRRLRKLLRPYVF